MAVDDRKPLGQSDAGAITPTVASSASAAPAAPASPAEDASSSASGEDLLRTAADPALTEDRFLALLKRGDLPAEVLERLAKNSAALKLRKVKLALVSHCHTPRHISVPLLRRFYTFDLMRVALQPGVPPDVKVAADQALAGRLKTITAGEKLTLARQGSGGIAGALLLDGEARVMNTALENGRLAEAAVIQAVLSPQAKAPLVQAVSRHAKWSLRREVRLALLRTEFLSLARALEFSRGLPPPLLREVLHSSRLPAAIKEQLRHETTCSDRTEDAAGRVSILSRRAQSRSR